MPCSFCNLPDHNITRCGDVLIDVHYDRMKKIYLNIIRKVYTRNIEIYTELGKSLFSARFNMKELRAVGVKYLNVHGRTSKANLILIIWRYFINRIFYILPEEEQPLDLENIQLIDMSTPSPSFIILQLRASNHVIFNYYLDDLRLVNYTFPMISVLADEASENMIPPPVLVIAEPEEVIPNINKKYNITPVLCLEDEEKENIDCAICYESIKCVDLVSLNCCHKFCSCCIIGILKTNKQTSPTCALCRGVICKLNIKKTEIYNLVSVYCNF